MNLCNQSPAERTGIIEVVSRDPRIWAPITFSIYFALELLTSWNGLSAPMYYDSAGWIEKRRYIFDSHSIAAVINIYPQRPLPMLSFYANFLLFDMRPLYFRLVDIFLLSICAVIVLALVRVSCRVVDQNKENSREVSAIAFCCGLMFALHPLQQQVTLYIWQRSALMVTLFYYAALLVYLHLRSGGIRREAWGYLACFGLFACALFSKENAVTLPVILILAEIALFRAKLKPLLVRGAAYFLVTFVLLAVLSGLERAYGDSANQPGIILTIKQYYSESGLTFIRVILTQCRSLFLYLYAILLPTGANGPLVYPMRISTALFSPPITFPAVAGTAALAALGLASLFKRPLTCFGILFFLVTLAPEGLFVPQYQYFGYRASLPMLGVIFVVADVASAIVKRAGRAQRAREMKFALSIAAILATAWLGAISVYKAGVWSDPPAFWHTTVAAFPEESPQVEVYPRAQAFHNLGLVLQERGLHHEAAKYLSKAAELEPKKPGTLSALAKSLSEIGRSEEAAELLSRALALDPQCWGAYKNLADTMMDQKRFTEAESLLTKGLALAPDSEDLNDALGRLYAMQGNADKAIAAFKSALRANPRGYISLSNLAVVLTGQGKDDEARELLERALKIRPDYWRAHQNIGVVYAMEDRIEEAFDHFRQAVLLNPTDASARRNLVTATEQLSEMKKRRSQPK